MCPYVWYFIYGLFFCVKLSPLGGFFRVTEQKALSNNSEIGLIHERCRKEIILTKKQIGKRFLQILIVLFGISFLTFGLTYLSPGDPAEIMLTECGNLPTPSFWNRQDMSWVLTSRFLYSMEAGSRVCLPEIWDSPIPLRCR